MAINIEWQALPTPNDDNSRQPQLYPRMTDNDTADFQQLCQKIAKHGSHTKGTGRINESPCHCLAEDAADLEQLWHIMSTFPLKKSFSLSQ